VKIARHRAFAVDHLKKVFRQLPFAASFLTGHQKSVSQPSFGRGLAEVL